MPTAALGMKAAVAKKRAVYLFRNIRIHLDRVSGLGTFVELEAVLGRGWEEAEGRVLIADLLWRFSVSEDDLVRESYCDVMDDGS
ncbi:MAG: CYTH domain-containing protein [Actinomycetota bacterium]|nr:CYTH domain-containing protein [Actinomycetota bacterium]